MKNRCKVLAVAIAVAFCVVDSQAQVSTRNKPRLVPGEIVVKYKSDTPQATAMTSLESAGVANIRTSPNIPFMVGKVAPGKKVEDVLNACRALPNVEYAEPNYRVYALETPQNSPVMPNDPRFEELWNLHQADDRDIDAPEAWAITKGSRDVIVGVIDTGIDYDHEDLKANIWHNPGESGDKATNKIDDDGNGYADDFRGWNFVFKNKDPYDNHGHGTHVAGTIGAVGDNKKGVAGVNWQVKLMALKFLDSNGEGTTADAAAAIIYATNNGARVLNNSWGGDEFSQALQEAIEHAHDRGVLFIAAAGNDGLNTDRSPRYPSTYEVPNVIAVGSSDRSDKLSGFSNFGRRTVDLVAPGSNILSAQPLSRYQILSGTSMAAPHVSGVCALIWAKYPNLKPHQVIIRLLGAVDRKPEFINCISSGGRLNAAQALATKPLIANTTDWRNTANTAGPYPVSTAVIAVDSLTSIRLIYNLNGTLADSMEMAAGPNDTYSAGIPGQPLNTTIEYAVSATDNAGNRTASPTYVFKTTSESDPRDKVGCCGQCAVTITGLDGAARLAAQIPINVAFFLLPIMLLRRKNRNANFVDERE